MKKDTLLNQALKRKDQLQAKIDNIEAKAEPYRDELKRVKAIISMYSPEPNASAGDTKAEPPSSPAPAVPPSETLPDFIKGKGKRPAGFDLADYDLSTAVGAKAAKTALLAVLDPLTPTARAEKFEELKGSTLVAALWNHGLEEDANQFTAKMAA